jgi:2-hydroxy-3-oxopropionate reductase
MKIGFIGLGVMGRPMAKNLIKAGHELHVFDIVQKSVDELVAAGAIAESSNRHVALQSEVVITMLPNSPHVKTAIEGKDGVLEGKHEGMKIVDMSSIAPLATKEIGKACQLAGVPLLESPVSGGEQGAINGTLSLMVGGDRTLFEELKPILKIMATNIMLCGDLGAGNTTKLINQHILAVEIAGIAEAFTMGKKAGVDPRVVYEAIHNGAAGSKIMDLKLPTVFDRNFKPGFRLDLHIKDLNNALETGYAIGSPMPLGSAVMDMMKFMSANGHGGEDHSTLMQYYEQIANVQITSENQK